MKTLKEQFVKAIHHYEHHAEMETDKEAKAFNDGRAQGFREALEYLKQFIG